ncbi:hypothetical protein DOTSEDRAFT_72424 [Dothistroma septosporum NZE10]|uniref:Uncharacterized protein n=1 Tax=Dothistroma septosporum (strain NZE10 / CBS 128990) TaxID=675120 RepID=M2YM88_DOTSN|nr:hypothetical protein DOTSEDRAFT_72424 [Dothistroma septosporum NZE10]
MSWVVLRQVHQLDQGRRKLMGCQDLGNRPTSRRLRSHRSLALYDGPEDMSATSEKYCGMIRSERSTLVDVCVSGTAIAETHRCVSHFDMENSSCMHTSTQINHSRYFIRRCRFTTYAASDFVWPRGIPRHLNGLSRALGHDPSTSGAVLLSYRWPRTAPVIELGIYGDFKAYLI